MNSINKTKNKSTITFFLMTEKGYEFLKGTSKKYKSLYGLVVVGSDKAIANDFEKEIIEYCQSNNIPFVRRNNFRGIDTEYVVAISWRWLIEHPQKKLIVFHDSLLPKYRGFAPLVNALINGETIIGVSAIFGADDFDMGDIIHQCSSSISYPLKINDAIAINNKNYIDCALTVLELIKNGEMLTGRSQKDEDATYSCWRDDDDYYIDWNKSSSFIKRHIDAVGYPYKGAASLYDDKIIRIIDAKIMPDVKIENRDVGKVLFLKDGKPIVICGEGMLQITEAYVDNGDAMLKFFPIQKFRMRFR